MYYLYPTPRFVQQSASISHSDCICVNVPFQLEAQPTAEQAYSRSNGDSDEPRSFCRIGTGGRLPSDRSSTRRAPLSFRADSARGALAHPGCRTPCAVGRLHAALELHLDQVPRNPPADSRFISRTEPERA